MKKNAMRTSTAKIAKMEFAENSARAKTFATASEKTFANAPAKKSRDCARKNFRDRKKNLATSKTFANAIAKKSRDFENIRRLRPQKLSRLRPALNFRAKPLEISRDSL